MKTRHAVIWGAILAATAVGCAAISGLDNLEEQPAGDGGLDAKPDTLDAQETAPDTTPDTAEVGDDTLDASEAGDDADAGDAPEVVDDADAMEADSADATDSADAAEAGADCGPTNTTTNCGACGASCDTTNSVGPNCSTSSGAAVCTYSSCATGYADCNKSGADLNGCETSIKSILNCAGCGNRCDTQTSLGATCNTGTTCLYTMGCQPGWADCITTAPNLDGCETPTTTVSDCGGCGNKCDTTTSNGASCSGGTCTYSSCKTGFANCDKTAPDTNGCESNLSSITSCGACGVVCDTTHTSGVTCTGGKCAHTSCAAGWTDCNATAPGNTADADGCECNTPVCCATGCGVSHTNCIGSSCGPLGQTYYDPANGCQPVGMPGQANTYNSDMAMAARAAWVPSGSYQDASVTCVTNPDAGTGDSAFSRKTLGPAADGGQTVTSCVVWVYTGPYAGGVYVSPPTDPTCYCPGDLTTTWN